MSRPLVVSNATATTSSGARQLDAEEPSALIRALSELADLEYRLGDWPAARVTAFEALRAARLAGATEETVRALTTLARVEAGLGMERACRAHAEEALRASRLLADPAAEAVAGETLGSLELALGRPEAAIERLEAVAQICADHASARCAAVTWPEDLVDAYIETGDCVGARRAARCLEERAASSGSCALVARWTRYQATLGGDDSFESLFRNALAWATRARQPFDRARTELCFGERLSRAGRPTAARPHLRAALEIFNALGAKPWVERSRRRLEATVARAS
jgi:tetratricopeptide (TPR) repeat protein